MILFIDLLALLKHLLLCITYFPTQHYDYQNQHVTSVFSNVLTKIVNLAKNTVSII